MSKKLISVIITFILIISIILGLYRIFPYFTVNIPLGYDPGIYRFMFLDYINNLPHVSFENIAEYTKGGLEPTLGFISNTLHLIGFDLDNLLSFGLGIFSIITSLFLYINLKKYGQITAVIGIIIFLISIIEYQAFWWNYYKQVIGIICMLTAFHILEKKKHILSIPIIIALFTIHKPSGVYFLITYLLYKIVNILIKRDKQTQDLQVIVFAGFIALLMYIPLFKEQILGLIQPLFTTVLTEGVSGTFFSKEDFGRFNMWVILASLYGIYQKIQQKDFDIISSGYVIGMIWVGFGLFFYNRFYIFFDIFIILMAAYGFGQLYKKSTQIFIILFPLFFIIQGLFYYNYVSANNSPLIPPKEFESIQQINSIVGMNPMIIVTHKHYSPWIAGYTEKPTITPGLFSYNIWNIEQWTQWWKGNGSVKCTMLEDYKKEYPSHTLYLWIGSQQNQENIENASCLENTSIDNEKHSLYKIVTP